MTSDAGHRCRACGCALRRGHPGVLCDPCARAARSYGQCPVPDGFYDTPALRAALATYDFGPVFRAVRLQAALSQEELGLMVGLNQSRVSAVERGEHRLRDVAVISRVAAALGIPAPLLGFPTSPAGSVNGQEVSWVDRRDFFTAVTAITLGAGLHPELQRLDALLPTRSDPPPPRRIGAADVKAVEETTAAFRLSDYRHGGGLSRAAAVAQLGYVLTLQDIRCSEPVRAQLLLATADLAMTAAWMTYDVEQHDAARRLWMIALDTARRADHPRSTDLTVILLLDLAHQALHLHRPDEALRLVQLSAATATSRTYPVSAGTRSYIAATTAWCHAALGHPEPCHRALGEAHQAYADTDPAAAPPWAVHVIPAELTAQHGHAFFLLARTQPQYAHAAIEHLRDAVDGFGPTYARSRAVNLPGLSSSYFRVGELTTAVTIGHEALTEISSLSSQRAYARLKTLAESAEPFQHNADVAELRGRIHHALVTAA
ncbi:helix-turn-helix domain-containing protein [Actinophytocola sp.]|uniref:helix-turn-helix domain-containing protein n=1 Tax=Actinophytocola sp. TaxID=1872138 RepID=UPI002D7FAD97|nr:helix-turn-helix domain-containing protein [Actinophytocola sp.]HET9141217.1 helix-turn-helix domain-containing protein [Actinophytocola sp.]